MAYVTSSIPAANNAPLLDVRDLCVDFVNGSAVTHAVRGVSFQLGREKLAIVGESGSGKSTVGRALLQLHPKKARVSASRMQFADLDLQHLSEAQMRGVRGKRISMIMQDPKYSLNPVVCVGKQIAEAWLTHHPGAKMRRKPRRWRCWRWCVFASRSAFISFIRMKYPADRGSAS
jgi:peptide/nickel transport system ATP-binding protein